MPQSPFDGRNKKALAGRKIDDDNGEDWYQQGDVLVMPEDKSLPIKSKPTILT